MMRTFHTVNEKSKQQLKLISGQHLLTGFVYFNSESELWKWAVQYRVLSGKIVRMHAYFSRNANSNDGSAIFYIFFSCCTGQCLSVGQSVGWFKQVQSSGYKSFVTCNECNAIWRHIIDVGDIDVDDDVDNVDDTDSIGDIDECNKCNIMNTM